MEEFGKTPEGIQTGVLPLNEVTAISGIDFFIGMKEGKYPLPPISATANMSAFDVEVGKVSFEAAPTADFYNPIGTIHGGYAAILLDTALGCSIHTTLEAGEAYTTMEIKVAYHRPIMPDMGKLVCKGEVISRGRRAASSEAKLYNVEGKLVASASTTCMIMAAPKG